MSLWAGEQFAADLHLCFPGLRIRTLSANKVLCLKCSWGLSMRKHWVWKAATSKAEPRQQDWLLECLQGG